MSRNARTVTISNNNVEFNVTHVRLSVRARSSRSIAFFIAYLYRESGQRVERWRTRRRSNDTKQTEKRVTFAFSHDSSDTYRSIGTCSSDDSRILPERFPTKLARATVFAVKETSITEQPRPSNQYIVAVCKCENENHATTSREACANKHEKDRAAFDENTERETEREREREREKTRTIRHASSSLVTVARVSNVSPGIALPFPGLGCRPWHFSLINQVSASFLVPFRVDGRGQG